MRSAASGRLQFGLNIAGSPDRAGDLEEQQEMQRRSKSAGVKQLWNCGLKPLHLPDGRDISSTQHAWQGQSQR